MGGAAPHGCRRQSRFGLANRVSSLRRLRNRPSGRDVPADWELGDGDRKRTYCRMEKTETTKHMNAEEV
jgi:hypothetical protein